MNVKKWTLLFAMIGVLLVTAFANDGNETAADRRDQFKERRAFFKENIKPKVDAKRNILEKSISDADKKEIVRLREELISQRLIENEFFFEARASRIKGEEVSEDLIDELKAQRIVIENLYDEAKLIANKYRPEIDDLLVELREDRKEWSEKMKPEGRKFEGKRGQAGRRGPFGHEDFPPMGRRFGSGGEGRLNVVTFLLWDVNRG
ncbi:MAG: hypothetical protein MI975_01275 [Cytophagales bacterium]|nr:hypothetical protein [Cytophagales bacterium]